MNRKYPLLAITKHYFSVLKIDDIVIRLIFNEDKFDTIEDYTIIRGKQNKIIIPEPMMNPIYKFIDKHKSVIEDSVNTEYDPEWYVYVRINVSENYLALTTYYNTLLEEKFEFDYDVGRLPERIRRKLKEYEEDIIDFKISGGFGNQHVWDFEKNNRDYNPVDEDVFFELGDYLLKKKLDALWDGEHPTFADIRVWGNYIIVSGKHSQISRKKSDLEIVEQL
jgi:hypothetical protein